MAGVLADSLTDVAGLAVGHWTDLESATGCTVILCPSGATAAVDVRGAAPATRETDLLRPENTVQQAHAVLLTGGSAFGLAAADGVMRYLEERGIGFPTSAGPVPIVPAASLFDLGLGSPTRRPGPSEGYAACLAASGGPVEQGSIGAGTGATVAHLGGRESRLKGGLGSASRRLRSGITVGAIVAVNAFGDILSTDGRVLAGSGRADGTRLRTVANIEDLAERPARLGEQTTLGLVATDADLSRPALLRVAQMAHDGLARAIRPAHTGYDGDCVFALATGRRPAVASTIVGAVAAELLALAVERAILEARSVDGVPTAREWAGC